MFKSFFPNIEVISSKYEETPSANKLVGEGDHLALGSLEIDVIYTPCHTRGHIIYIISGSSGSPIIFSGMFLVYFIKSEIYVHKSVQ